MSPVAPSGAATSDSSTRWNLSAIRPTSLSSNKAGSYHSDTDVRSPASTTSVNE